MKKLLALAALCALLLCGCATSPAPNLEARPGGGAGVSVVCTVFPCYDLARAALGGAGEITMLISPGAEPHNYDPSPSEILKIRKCDVFVMIGGESEEWAEAILSSLEADVRVVRLMDSVEALEEDDEGIEQAEEGEEEGALDEHIWTSPRNMIAMLDAVEAAICEAAPAMAGDVEKNAAEYRAELTKLDQDFARAVSEGRRSTLVFGDRFPFLYFVKAYGLSYRAAFPGCSSASEPSVSVVAALAKAVRAEKIPVVFQLERSAGRVAQALAQETGAKVLTFHSCHNVSGEEFDAGDTYVTLMRQNLENLREALQ